MNENQLIKDLYEALENLIPLWDREDVADDYNDDFLIAEEVMSKVEKHFHNFKGISPSEYF